MSPLAGEASLLPPRGSSSLKCLLLKHLLAAARLNTSMERLKAYPFKTLLKHPRVFSERDTTKDSSIRENVREKVFWHWRDKSSLSIVSVMQLPIDSNKLDTLGCDGSLFV